MKNLFVLICLTISIGAYSGCPDLAGVYSVCQLKNKATNAPIGEGQKGLIMSQTTDSNQVVIYESEDLEDGTKDTFVTNGAADQDGDLAVCVNDMLNFKSIHQAEELLISKSGDALIIQFTGIRRGTYYICQ